MDSAASFQPRAFQPGDEAEILRLFEVAFGHRRSLAHWRWKFEQNPWRRRQISLTFAPDGALVAQYAGYPVPWHDTRSHPARDLVCMHIGDTMTQPGYRRIGRGDSSLLGRTMHHFFATFCEGQVAVNFGFNTDHVRRFLQRFARGRYVEDVPFWTLENPARRVPNRARLASPRLFSRYRAAPSPAVDEEWSDLFRRACPAYGSLARRDATYLDWRYVKCPDRAARLWAVRHRGRLVGWGAFRRVAEDLQWGDALFDPRHRKALPALLRAVLAAESEAGAGPARLTGWFTERPHWWAEWLESAGFRRNPEPNGLGLICLPFLEPDAERGLLGQAYYTQGDSDLF